MYAVRRLISAFVLAALGLALGGCVIAPYGDDYGRGRYYERHHRHYDSDGYGNRYYVPG